MSRQEGIFSQGRGLNPQNNFDIFSILTEKLFNTSSLAKTFENTDELLIDAQPILGRKAWYNSAMLYIHYPSRKYQWIMIFLNARLYHTLPPPQWCTGFSISLKIFPYHNEPVWWPDLNCGVCYKILQLTPTLTAGTQKKRTTPWGSSH